MENKYVLYKVLTGISEAGIKCAKMSTFLTLIIPSCVSLSVVIPNMSYPSPSVMLYSISAFSSTSASLAFILPTGESGGVDSGTLNWYVPTAEGEGSFVSQSHGTLDTISQPTLHAGHAQMSS